MLLCYTCSQHSWRCQDVLPGQKEVQHWEVVVHKVPEEVHSVQDPWVLQALQVPSYEEDPRVHLDPSFLGEVQTAESVAAADLSFSLAILGSRMDNV